MTAHCLGRVQVPDRSWKRPHRDPSNVGQRPGKVGECHSVVFAQYSSAPSQPFGFRELFRRIHQPALYHAPSVTGSSIAVRERKVGIELDRSAEEAQRLGVGFAAGSSIEARQSTQIVIVSIEALGRLALGPLHFGLLQLRPNRPDHARRYLILQIENVIDTALPPNAPAQRCGPVDAPMSWAAIRSRSPALRTLPSST